MESTFKPGICGLLEGMQTIRERMVRDEATLEHMYANVQRLIQQGSSSGNHVLDIVLRYGLPHQTGNLEKNLHLLNEQLKVCAGQFIVTELISYDRNDRSNPKVHQATVGVLTDDAPVMRYIDEEKVFSGIVIPTTSQPRILLAETFINELRNGEKPFWGLLNSSLHYSFEIAIGYESVWKFLSPERQSFTETPETRQVRMKRIARELNDLSLTHGMSIHGHRELQDYIRQASSL